MKRMEKKIENMICAETSFFNSKYELGKINKEEKEFKRLRS